MKTIQYKILIQLDQIIIFLDHNFKKKKWKITNQIVDPSIAPQ